jgi:hypothetical protein
MGWSGAVMQFLSRYPYLVTDLIGVLLLLWFIYRWICPLFGFWRCPSCKRFGFHRFLGVQELPGRENGPDSVLLFDCPNCRSTLSRRSRWRV